MRNKILGALFIIILLFFTYWAKVLWLDIPALRSFHPHNTAFMNANHVEQELTWKSFEQIPPYLRQAIVAAEDDKFYQHRGVDFEALKKAWSFNSKKKKYARGGSTITMQLARNLYLSAHKNMFRKVVEIFLALRIELALSKDKILENYLNVIEFGDGVFGVGNAAEHYFHKPLELLGKRELTFLVAIIPSPKKWGHWPPSSFVQRRMDLISRRIGGGKLSEPLQQALEAKEEKILETQTEPEQALPEEELPILEEKTEEILVAPVPEADPEPKKEFKTIEGE